MGRFNEIIQEKGLAHIGSSRLVPSLFPCYELEMKTGKRREVSQNEVGSPKMSEAFSSSTLHDAWYPVSTKASPQALLFHCCPPGGERAHVRLRVAFASAFTEP